MAASAESTPRRSSLATPAVRTAIDTIRLLSADMVEKAKSGHPGTPMEAAPLAYLLFARHMRHNPGNPDWAGRDRFILSCGHASALIYSMLHLCGYGLTLDDLKNFRQLNSKTPGHPEFGHTVGVETTTGPLGQGISTSVGMAMGSRYLAAKVDADLFDYRIYAICSDGDLMEGVSSEAASIAGHLKLGNIINLYLDNKITIEGTTEIAFSEEVATRYLSYGWHVERVEGENLDEVDAAIERAKLDPRPSMIIARTHIGQGAPTKQDTPDAHGAPLGAEELAQTKVGYGFDPAQSFVVSDDVYDHFAAVIARGGELEAAWQKEADTRGVDLAKAIAVDFDALKLPAFTPADGALATRQASGKVLNTVAPQLPFMLGGSADLGPSNNTTLKGEESFSALQVGRNIHFGVREHAMGAILNGLCHTPGLIPFGGTFLVFFDYMKPAIRLAALMGLAPIYVFTHDSIGLGEDGPTHQPIEHLASLRSIPNINVLRPCDANETAEAWRIALADRTRPSALILSRQGLPTLDRSTFAPVEGVRKGGYVLAAEEGELKAILIGTGAEVHLALEARERLQKDGIGTRVVSLPSWELFERQDAAYKASVLPATCTLRVAVEAAAPFGWERYVGIGGGLVCMQSFGASAPAGKLMEFFGITADAVEAAVRTRLG